MPLSEPVSTSHPTCQHANMQDVPTGGHRNEATSASTGWPFCLACSVRQRHWPKSSHRSRCHAVSCPAAERATFTPCKAVLAVSQPRFWCNARTVYYLQPLDAVIAGGLVCSRAFYDLDQMKCRLSNLTHTLLQNSGPTLGKTKVRSRSMQASKRSHHSKCSQCVPRRKKRTRVFLNSSYTADNGPKPQERASSIL
jgi:hypothetical protein